MQVVSRLVPLLLPLAMLACKPKPGPEPTPPTQDEPKVAPVEAEPLACQRPETFGPVIVSASQYAARHGATATSFAELTTTKDQPAEVCGIGAGVDLLLDLRCADGSNPFKTFQDAHGSRAGNVGSGGRCGSIIDLYQVPCPEQTYAVYIDSYICADAAAFR